MIDYEEVVEAIWRYDIPRIDIDEDVTTLYADGKAFAQVIRRPDGSREDLYFEDYELQKDTLIKPNAKLRDVVELCMNGDISYVDVREWCIRIRLIRSAIIILTTVAIRSRSFSVLQVWIQAVLPSGMAMKVVWTKMVSWKFAVVCPILTLARVIMRRFVSLSMVTII